MKKTFKYILLFQVLLWSTYLCAQQGKNPFDLEGRERTIPLSIDSALTITNPLDIVNEPIEESNIDNPFDVSHIPLQRKDVAKKKVSKKTVQTPSNSSIWDFRFWILLFSSILLAILLSQARDKVYSLSKAILNQNYLKALGRDHNNGFSLLFISLYSLFFLNISLFAYNAIGQFGAMNGINEVNYFFILLGIIGMYFAKHIILSLTGFIFPVNKFTSTYSFSVVFFNSILGLILLPINIITLFGPDRLATNFVYIGIGIILIFFIYRIMNGIILASKFITSHFFHFFLYLCSCEIAPLVIIYKLFS